VNLRFRAYPYQKFGVHRGSVVDVSTASSFAGELIGVDATSSIFNQGEPLYRVIVKLDAQSVTTYGMQNPLHAGMLVDADILQETRKLYEWILEPLYTLSGRVR